MEKNSKRRYFRTETLDCRNRNYNVNKNPSYQKKHIESLLSIISLIIALRREKTRTRNVRLCMLLAATGILVVSAMLMFWPSQDTSQPLTRSLGTRSHTVDSHYNHTTESKESPRWSEVPLRKNAAPMTGRVHLRRVLKRFRSILANCLLSSILDLCQFLLLLCGDVELNPGPPSEPESAQAPNSFVPKEITFYSLDSVYKNSGKSKLFCALMINNVRRRREFALYGKSKEGYKINVQPNVIILDREREFVKVEVLGDKESLELLSSVQLTCLDLKNNNELHYVIEDKEDEAQKKDRETWYLRANEENSEFINEEATVSINDPQVEGIDTYKKEGLYGRVHGDLFHISTIIYMLFKLYKQNIPFKIGAECSPAGIFDDIYVRYKNKNLWQHVFMQLKHSRNKNKQFYRNELYKNGPGLLLSSYESQAKINQYVTKIDKENFKKSIIHYLFYSNLVNGCDCNETSSSDDNTKAETPLYTMDNFNVYDWPINWIFKDYKNIKRFVEFSDEIRKKLKTSKLSKDNDINELLVRLIMSFEQFSLEEMEDNIRYVISAILDADDFFKDKVIIPSIWKYIVDWINQPEGTFIDNQMFSSVLNTTVEGYNQATCSSMARNLIEGYTGREVEQKQVEETLEEKGKETIDVLLTGNENCGKTQLALKIIAELKKKNSYDFIFWIPSDSVLSIRSWLNYYSNYCLLSDVRNEENVQQIYSLLPKLKYMFVFDDISDDVDIMKFLPDSETDLETLFIMCTSETNKWKSNKHIPVPNFKESELIVILKEYFPNVDEASIIQLAKLLENEIMALPLILAYEKNYTPESNENAIECILRLIQQYRDDVESRSVLECVCLIVLDEMKKEALHKEAMDLINSLCYFHNENIPKKLFQEMSIDVLKKHNVISIHGNFISIQHDVQKVYLKYCTIENYNTALRLIERGLKVLYKSNDTPLFVPHVQRFVEQFERHKTGIEIKKTDDEIRRNQETKNLLFQLVDYITDYPIDIESKCILLEQFLRYQPAFIDIPDSQIPLRIRYIDLLFQIKKYETAIAECLKLLERDDIAIKSLITIKKFQAQILQCMESFKPSLLIWRETYNLCFKFYGGNAEESEEIIMNLCECLSQLFNLEGAEYLVEMFDVLQRRYPAFNSNTIKAISDMESIATWIKLQPYKDEPLQLYEFVYKVTSLLYGETHLLTIAMLLGLVQKMLQHDDKNETAVKTYKRVICWKPTDHVKLNKDAISALYAKLLDIQNDGISLLNILINALKNIQSRENEFVASLRAILLLEEDFRIFFEYQRMVDKIQISWEKKKYKQVQKKSSQFLGNLPDYAFTYPDILKIRYYQSASLLHLGKDSDSWKLMKELYNDMLSVFGSDAVLTLETLKSLGTLALKLKRKEFTEWQKLIENRSHRSNVNHDVTLNILNAIAVGESEAKQIEPVYNKVLNQILNNHSNRSEIVLKTMIHKTKNMLGCGRKVNALQEARKLRQNIVSVLGKESALATEALKVKAKCLRVLDRHEEALDAYDDMYNDAKSLGGKFDTKALEILMGKAKCLTDMKNFHDAISLYDEVSSLAKEARGETDSQSIAALLEKSRCLVQLKQYSEAITIYNSLIEITTHVHGVANTQSIQLMIEKANCLIHQQSFDLAIEVYDAVYTSVVATRGDKDPQAIQALIEKGQCLCKTNSKSDAIDALAIYDKAHAAVVSARGEADAQAIAVLKLKAWCCRHNLSRSDEANAIYTEIRRIQKSAKNNL